MSYVLKERPAASGNHGGTRTAGKIRYIVIHYTGNDGDKAANNAAYYQNNVVKASAHYFVDDTTVYRSVPELTVAWAVGGKRWTDCGKTGGGTMYGIVTNTNSISVELCDTVKNGNYGATEATLSNAAELVRTLMKKYNIPVENVCRHFDVTGKHCPAYMMDGAVWKAFKDRLIGVPAGAAVMDNTPSAAHKDGVEWCRKNGILAGDTSGDLKLSQPVTRQQFCTMLYRFAKSIGKA